MIKFLYVSELICSELIFSLVANKCTPCLLTLRFLVIFPCVLIFQKSSFPLQYMTFSFSLLFATKLYNFFKLEFDPGCRFSYSHRSFFCLVNPLFHSTLRSTFDSRKNDHLPTTKCFSKRNTR